MTGLPRWLAAVGIVTAAWGCDNIAWGGIEISLRGPAGDSLPSRPPPTDSVPPPESPLSLGPLVYVASRTGNMAVLSPLGELGAGGLLSIFAGSEGERVAKAVLAERMRPGAEFVLLSHGLRVGTLTLAAEGAEVSRESCLPRPRARGYLELVPEGADLQRFMALEKERGRGTTFGFRGPLRDQYEHRAASLALAAEAIRSVGAPWPAELREARQEIHLVPLAGKERPWILATFLYQDVAQIGPPGGRGAYSLLVLGEPQLEGWRLVYSGYRPVASRGKGVPRFFAASDWDQDGQMEIVLEILGERHRWWAVLGQIQGAWDTIFEDPCEAPPDRP